LKNINLDPLTTLLPAWIRPAAFAISALLAAAALVARAAGLDAVLVRHAGYPATLAVALLFLCCPSQLTRRASALPRPPPRRLAPCLSSASA
jgi:hypothetical protein